MGWCLKQQQKIQFDGRKGVILFCEEGHSHLGTGGRLGGGRICIGNRQGEKVIRVEERKKLPVEEHILLAMNMLAHLDTWSGNWNGDEAPKGQVHRESIFLK